MAGARYVSFFERRTGIIVPLLAGLIHALIALLISPPDLRSDALVTIIDPVRFLLLHAPTTHLHPVHGIGMIAGILGVAAATRARQEEWLQHRHALALKVLFSSVLGVFLFLVVAPIIADPRFQTNYFTGNPLFFLPVFAIFGASPGIIRLSLIAFMAGSTVLSGLVYHRLFGSLKQVIALLLLFNMNLWLVFRAGDYAYTLFLSMVIIYLFTIWRDSQSPRILYLGAFLAGLFFYFKATVAYVVIGLAVGALVEHGKQLFRDIGFDSIAVAAGVLLIGTTPFWIYSLSTGTNPFGDVWTVNDNYIAINDRNLSTTPDATEILQKRVKDMVFVTTPDATLDGKSLHNPPIHVLFLLLITGIALAIVRRQHTVYAVALLTTFTLLLVVPNGLYWRQLTVLLPLVPIPVIAAVQHTPLDWRHLAMASTFLLAATMTISVGTLFEQHARDTTIEVDWSGDQRSYRALQDADLGTIVFTNAWTPYVLSKYDLSIHHVYLLAPERNWTGENWWATRNNRRNRSVLQQENGSIILGSCSQLELLCGYNASTIHQSINHSAYRRTTLTLKFKDYSVYTRR